MTTINAEPVVNNDKSSSKTTSNMKTPITSFYANKTVFITGATGFVGKVRVEFTDVKFNFLLGPT